MSQPKPYNKKLFAIRRVRQFCLVLLLHTHECVNHMIPLSQFSLNHSSAHILPPHPPLRHCVQHLCTIPFCKKITIRKIKAPRQNTHPTYFIYLFAFLAQSRHIPTPPPLPTPLDAERETENSAIPSVCSSRNLTESLSVRTPSYIPRPHIIHRHKLQLTFRTERRKRRNINFLATHLTSPRLAHKASPPSSVLRTLSISSCFFPSPPPPHCIHIIWYPPFLSLTPSFSELPLLFLYICPQPSPHPPIADLHRATAWGQLVPARRLDARQARRESFLDGKRTQWPALLLLLLLC